MSTLTLELDSSLAHSLEESARREHKPVAAWARERIMEHYVSIRRSLDAIAKGIGEADLWIAATARANGDAIVTNNTDEFGRVPDLAVEDWSA